MYEYVEAWCISVDFKNSARSIRYGRNSKCPAKVFHVTVHVENPKYRKKLLDSIFYGAFRLERVRCV